MSDQNSNGGANPVKPVDASPSKSFFVEMLTRDIELKDAILDLLDNCLDGVLRTLKERKLEEKKKGTVKPVPLKPYTGFHARIEFGKNFFRISDNCGGMTKEILEKHAFRLGRPALDRDKDLPTVGLYGIGMKRAIFKMGRSCVVSTRNGNKAYQVNITPKWLADDDDWRLDISEIDPTKLEKGTVIEIRNLRDGVSAEFDQEKNKEFEEDFRTLVSTHYSYIMHKGFSVKVNYKDVRPREIQLRFATEANSKGRLAPYLFRGEVEGVNVELAIGFYRNIPTQAEIDSMDTGGGFRKENAGWTVICNDRVVLFNDTTHITGWGEGSVPKYHTQFIAISGVVRFSSNNPQSLPLTTTKRGINLNSPLYAEVKNIMREGTKHFTDFTNRWKGAAHERKDLFEKTDAVEPLKAYSLVKDKEWTTSKKYTGRKFVPKLPIPSEDADSNKVIRFLRPKSEITKVAEYLFEDSDTPASTVGEKCFDDYYKLAESEN